MERKYVKVNLHMSKDFADSLKAKAEQCGMTFNAYFVDLLRKCLDLSKKTKTIETPQSRFAHRVYLKFHKERIKKNYKREDIYLFC